MPAVVRSAASPRSSGITKLTNCRLVRGDALVWEDVWVSSATGRILRSQEAFYDAHAMPDETVDLGGRIVAPGFIECQLNGAFGFNFSTVADDMAQYAKQLRDLNRKLARTGVTSYVPTVTSQTSELYKKVSIYDEPGKERKGKRKKKEIHAHHFHLPSPYTRSSPTSDPRAARGWPQTGPSRWARTSRGRS